MTIRAFTCAICGADCLTDTTETEMNQELLESKMPIGENDELLSACDECYQIAMLRARHLGLIE